MDITIDQICQQLVQLELDDLQSLIDFDFDQLAIHYLLTDGQYHYPPPERGCIFEYDFQKIIKYRTYLETHGRGYRLLEYKIDQLADLYGNSDLIPDRDSIETYVDLYLNGLPPAVKI